MSVSDEDNNVQFQFKPQINLENFNFDNRKIKVNRYLQLYNLFIISYKHNIIN